jgi:hypothetical protein
VTLPTSLRLKDGRWAIIRLAQPGDAETWINNLSAVAAEGVYMMTEQVTKTAEEFRQRFSVAYPKGVLYLAAEVEGALVGGADVRRGAQSKHAHVAERQSSRPR